MKSFWEWTTLAGRSHVRIISLGIALAISYSATVQAESQPPVELDRLKYFEGNWNCRQPADNTDPSGKFIWNVELDLNDFWYLAKVTQTQPAAPSQPINSREFFGYDIVAKQLIHSVVKSDGSSYNMTANDWENNQLVWTGTIIRQGKSAPLRQATVQDSADKFTTTYFVAGDSDNWIPVVNETCDRSL